MVKEITRYLRRIEVLSSRNSSGCYDSLSDRQKYLYSVLKHMGGEDGSQNIKRRDIQAACEPSFTVEDRRNVVTDFCYNKVNLEDNENKFLLSIGKGLLHFVDFDWQPEHNEPVTWKVDGLKKFTVGGYKDSQFQWNFDELVQALQIHFTS
jgi:hypothetical protein